MPLHFFYTAVQKSQKMTKNPIQGGKIRWVYGSQIVFLQAEA